MIEKPNKTRLRNGLIAVLLAITLIAPAVFQGPAQAASKRTPTRPAITKVTATKNSATVISSSLKNLESRGLIERIQSAVRRKSILLL